MTIGAILGITGNSNLILCFSKMLNINYYFYAALTMIYLDLMLHQRDPFLSHFMPLFTSQCGNGMMTHTCTSDLKAVPWETGKPMLESFI